MSTWHSLLAVFASARLGLCRALALGPFSLGRRHGGFDLGVGIQGRARPTAS